MMKPGTTTLKVGNTDVTYHWGTDFHANVILAYWGFNESFKGEAGLADFKTALDFVDKVGAVAESEGHHPEIEFGWGHCTVRTYTHKIHGLHENDFILAAKMLPATLLVIPLFGIFRMTGMIGSLWSIVLAHATLIVPFTTWMLKGYFDTIPRELEQAAMVDGCSPFGALFRVILPVAAPGLAATALYGFVLAAPVVASRPVIDTIENGIMTKDLALLISKDAPWLTTEDFLDALDRRLQAKMG